MERQGEGGSARTVADRRGPPLRRGPRRGRSPAGVRPPRWLLAGLLILTVPAALAGAARGEPAPPRPPVPAPGPAQPGAAGAAADSPGDPVLLLIDQAAEDYDQGRFEDAVAGLERAYRISPRPLLLFNKAQVLRQMKACARARDAYDQFLAATPADDPDRERAVAWRQEMAACSGPPPGTGAPAPAPGGVPRLAAGAAAAPAPGDKLTAAGYRHAAKPAPPPTVVRAEPLAPPPPPRARERRWPIVGWAALAIATVAGVTAGALAWRASALSSELSAAEVWGPGLESKQEEGARDARWARWLAVGAGAAGLGGAAVLIWLPAASPGSAAAGHAPAPVAGALFGYAGTF